MQPRDLLDRASIADVWVALGGGPLRSGRSRAFWRDGDGFNVSVSDAKNAFFDHAHGAGGGVLRLIEVVHGCDRRDALEWLARHHNITLDGRRPLTRQEKRDYAIRRADAERKAAKLTGWRRDVLQELRDEKNRLFESENLASAVARVLLECPGTDDEAAWQSIWQHAFDDQEADEIQREIERIESMMPAELATEMEAAA